MYMCTRSQQDKLFPETEGFTIAITIQDQAIATRNYPKHIIKDLNTPDDKCRKCKQSPETIDHTTGRCKLLVNIEYTERTILQIHTNNFNRK